MTEPERELQSESSQVLPEGKITPEALAKLRSMIGIELRCERLLRQATFDALRSFVNAVGDRNPLFRDHEYAQWTRYGSIIAHPTFLYARHYPGRTRFGLPGVHGFFGGNDWQFFRALRPGDEINCTEQVIGVEEKESQFSGILVVSTTETVYTNQRDEVIAKAKGWSTRHERKASREKGKYQKAAGQEHTYSNQELETINRAVLDEPKHIRGGEPRYWEDVQEGEELTPIVRGPLSIMDLTAFLGATRPGKAHGVLLEEALRHPGHFFRNREGAGGVEYTGGGHTSETVANQVGVPGAYDYGPQRISWLASLLVNWMGDAGWLRRMRAELRRFNVVGDTTWLKGKVVRKHVENGEHLVDIDCWSENQRHERTMPGFATVRLLSRSVNDRHTTANADRD